MRAVPSRFQPSTLARAVNFSSGFQSELQSAGPRLLAAERVVLAGEGVVDPVGLRLVEERRARRQGVGEAASDRRREVDVVVGAVRDPREAVGVLRRPAAVELDDARRGVASEERALRPAQHFRALEVEEGLALEHGVLEHHVVDDHRDRLRGVEVEVGVAEAADVEARERPAERGLQQEAGHPRRERLDVGAARLQEHHLIGVERRHREGDILDVLLALLRRHGDLLEELEQRGLGLRLLGLGLVGLGLRLCGLLGEGQAAGRKKHADSEHSDPPWPTRRLRAHEFLP